MKTRAFDPRRLDVAAAAAQGVALDGRCALSALTRLADEAVGAADQPVVWSGRFEQRPARVGAPEVWLHLRASARVARECQRCLQAVPLALEVERAFRFVATEDEAAALDLDSEDDVLALSRQFDLLALVEDELLLALPLVPKHEQCPAPLAPPPHADEDADEPTPAHPFAALQALKRSRGP